MLKKPQNFNVFNFSWNLQKSNNLKHPCTFHALSIRLIPAITLRISPLVYASILYFQSVMSLSLQASLSPTSICGPINVFRWPISHFRSALTPQLANSNAITLRGANPASLKNVVRAKPAPLCKNTRTKTCFDICIFPPPLLRVAPEANNCKDYGTRAEKSKNRDAENHPQKHIYARGIWRKTETNEP